MGADLRAVKQGKPRALRHGLTARQEAFAREIVGGCSGAEAARRAGYSARRANRAAYELVTNRDVRRRIDELLQLAAARVPVTLERHVEQLVWLRETAMNQGQCGHAIRAQELIGRVLGYFHEAEKPGRSLEEDAVKLSLEEQLAIFQRTALRLGFALILSDGTIVLSEADIGRGSHEVPRCDGQ